ARPWHVLARQLKSPILILLFVTAGVSVFLGEATNAVIIGVILVASTLLGFVNEFRAERAADALHDRVRRTVVVRRDGEVSLVEVTHLVPGDIVQVKIGDIVPADIRVLSCHDLACDESILTGESLPADKASAPVSADAPIAELSSCLLMGTVVQAGTAVGVVVDTGDRTEFGRIAAGLGGPQPQTEFQRGLGRFSVLLLEVALVLTTLIFIGNVLLQRPVLDSLLFSLAIAVGITPQLLPAVVSASLAAGSRSLAKRNVLVKRLVCIEDLGDMDLLITDKTGTLTEGRLAFVRAISVSGESHVDEVLRNGLLATETTYASGAADTLAMNPLDAALWSSGQAAAAQLADASQLDLLPFDHERRMTSALVRRGTDTLVVTKGSADEVFAACTEVAAAARHLLEQEYAAGSRVVAVAHREAPGQTSLTPADEQGLTLDGVLVFRDPPKDDARSSLEKLAALGIDVKIATGDSAVVAEKVLRDLGVDSQGTLSGTDIDGMDDETLRTAAPGTTVFARVSPEQKARVIEALRHTGRAVAFLGDGVNDALALHQADIGISVDSAADVAKDAADVLLLDKDLGVLADGVTEGRRIFANTIKYVLMGTSSNFGNMFSASVASVVLSFLPMLPGQILLNNLLYDVGQLAIPGDRVDKEQLLAPAHWNIGYIRRFMFLFGPISSIFDFATFALMLLVFQAGPPEFRAGWFIESLATQTLIIFAIRTRRVPFLRSRPSLTLTLAALGVVAVGVWLPYSPLSGVLGFTALPVPFFLALVAMIVTYLLLVEVAKRWFFSRAAQTAAHTVPPPRSRGTVHRVRRRASRFHPSRTRARGSRR
ncbi:MAG: magnesium-translocating P-type ATPase, partial [Pseudolysinimonas sp.]